MWTPRPIQTLNHEHPPPPLNENQFNTPSHGTCKSYTFLSMFLLFHFLDSNSIINTAFIAVVIK